MSGADGEALSPTDEQRVVIERSVDARVLVTAGPGAGKTHTLIRRLDFLAAHEGVGAGEILVLTFSRAAVRELRERTVVHGGASRNIRAQTFDAWALDLLMRVDANGGWTERSFDERIEGARLAIEDGLAEEEFGEDLLHVVIDEVQDLVGPRRELVETLLDTFAPGFTMVGDPAQSIYGFTITDTDSERRNGEAGRFFVWLRNTYGEDLVELTLSENFRVRTPEVETALPYGPGLRSVVENGRPDDGTDHAELRGALRRTLTLGPLDEFGCRALASHEGTAAVLCRTNGQALLLSERLWAGGAVHRLQRSASDRGAPAWLASLFRSTEGSSLTKAGFDRIAEPVLGVPNDGRDGIWTALLRSARGPGGSRNVDMGRLRTAVATGRLSDELTAQPRADLIVSSFHRAKGLEFDRVVVVDPGDLPPARATSPTAKGGKRHARPPVDAGEEARLLYVAMTRARDELLRLDPSENRHVRLAREVGRWARYSFRSWARLGLELRRGDVHTDHPAGVKGFAEDPRELQDYLSTEVAPGDEVTVERLSPHAIALGESPPYLLVHGGRPIGVMSERFRRDLYRFLKLGPSYEPRNWPCRITGVRIDSVETVAGGAASGIESGLGPHGVWLAPRPTGLSTFVYDPKKTVEDNDVVAQ